ncbi:acetylglutamate kinase [Candidatus Gottesmanbacteria bacterium RBG_16_37_8]|uniref:Acetylglutamate kinase n=1 Tax=Candidatus Gottesmanbacteria bacterium RBG_16_37_8 TaxID=1798371 RepID=A0A1F5YR43_9BACT|nr:MAG: acetylglutamate kinase [Candidatus Gottesmanbacteria bacterium RBG_16_37_8]
MIIIKVGGGKAINWDYLAEDLSSINEKYIIVHGANAFMKEISNKLGITQNLITSPSGHISRYTDAKTLELLTMVYCGLVNKKIVSCLQKHKINAVGLSGADGKLWLGIKKETILSKVGTKTKIITDSLTGKVESVNVELISMLLDKNYTPVITIPAITKDGELINVDNDRAVSVMAKDLQVKTLVFLFEESGLLEKFNDPTSKIDRINKDDLEKYLESSEGRMKKKLLGVKEAFAFGVKSVYFGDGRIEKPVSQALKGNGTVIN